MCVIDLFPVFSKASEFQSRVDHKLPLLLLLATGQFGKTPSMIGLFLNSLKLKILRGIYPKQVAVWGH